MNLSDLLHDAVDGVEPTDRIAEIRERTADPARSAARPWFYAAGAVVLATAAAVTAFAVLGNDSPASTHHDHHVATSPAPTTDTFLVPAYYVGDTLRGPRLFREFDQASGPDALNAALAQIQRPASDPDYRTSWTPGSFDSATLADGPFGDGTIEVVVDDAALDAADDLALQQVVYTLRAAAHRDWPVHFTPSGLIRPDGPVPQMVDADPQVDVLAFVNISDPAEGSSYHGSMVARGRANSFEGNVPWQLWAENGEVMASGHATADGWGDRLYPWEVDVDLSDLPPGDYTFIVQTDDPSDGEGSGPDLDTRQITVR